MNTLMNIINRKNKTIAQNESSSNDHCEPRSEINFNLKSKKHILKSDQFDDALMKKWHGKLAAGKTLLNIIGKIVVVVVIVFCFDLEQCTYI